jgi:hypothetical protein
LIVFARVYESDDVQLRRQHDPTLGPPCGAQEVVNY